MRRTKIIATVGPATSTEHTLKELINAGVDTFRLNFSHGTHESWQEMLSTLKTVRGDRSIPFMLDTKGPEIRTGLLKTPAIPLHKDATITFVGSSKNAAERMSDEQTIYLTYDGLEAYMQKGLNILLEDGAVRTVVESVQDDRIVVRILNEACLGDRKGVNIPGAGIPFPSITEQDEKDIAFGVRNGIDSIAVSFVRQAHDVIVVRKLLNSLDAQHVQIISKIENQEGVNNIDEIISVSDGIMVARGDLGVEIPFEYVPHIQETLIQKTLAVGKTVITATHMLNSMITNPVPTRAEVNDVYSAVKNLTSCIMLSGETAQGTYPVESVHAMDSIARRAEAVIDYSAIRSDIVNTTTHLSPAVCYAALQLAKRTNTRAIVVFTESGTTARYLSAYRSSIPIIAVTPYPHIARQLNLVWGITPHVDTITRDMEAMFADSVSLARNLITLEDGDTLVSLAGTNVGIAGSTNTIRVLPIGDIISRGRPYSEGIASGNICICESLHEAKHKLVPGTIAVIYTLTADYIDLLENLSGILIAGSNYDTKTLDAAKAKGIPVITDIRNVENNLVEGERVTINATKGVVLRAQPPS